MKHKFGANVSVESVGMQYMKNERCALTAAQCFRSEICLTTLLGSLGHMIGSQGK